MTLENLPSEKYRKLHHYSYYDELRSEKDMHFHISLKNIFLSLRDYKNMVLHLWLKGKATVP